MLASSKKPLDYYGKETKAVGKGFGAYAAPVKVPPKDKTSVDAKEKEYKDGPWANRLRESVRN